MLRVSRFRNYLAGLVTGYTVTIATIIVGFWLTPFTLRFLNREQFAVFSIASDMLIWLTLLDLGTSAALSNQAAQLIGIAEKERINRLVSTAFYAQMIIVLIMLIFGGALALFFPYFFGIRTDLMRDATLVMLLLVVGSAISLGTKTFSVLLIANQQIYIDNFINLALLLVRTALTVLLLLTGWGLISLAIANIVATTITSALSIMRTRKTLPEVEIRFDYFSWGVFRKTFDLGLWFTLGSLAGILILSLDRAVAAKIVSLDSVTTLILTGKIYILSGGLLQQITNTSRPILGQLIGQNKKEQGLRIFQHLFMISTGGSIIVAITLWSANGAFVAWWVGKQNYGGWLLDLALAVNLAVHSWVLPNRAALAAGLANVRRHNISRLVEGGVNLILSVILGIKFGLVGIAIGTGVAGIVTSCWYLPMLTARMFGVSFGQITVRGFTRIIFIGLILFPVALSCRFFGSQSNGVLGFILPASVTGISGLMLLWFIGVDRDVRVKILFLAHKMMRKNFPLPKAT